MPILIAFEGPDSSGKTTQKELLTQRLIDSGYHVESYKCPNASKPFGKKIYEMLSTGSALKFPTFFQILQFFDKLGLNQKLQERSIESHADFVIIDRWVLSSLVYGRSTGVSKILLKIMSMYIQSPHITIYSKLNFSRQLNDEYDKDVLLQERVRLFYEKYSKDSSVTGHLIKLETPGTEEEIFDEIWDNLKNNFYVKGY